MHATFELEANELRIGGGPICGVDEAGRDDEARRIEGLQLALRTVEGVPVDALDDRVEAENAHDHATRGERVHCVRPPIIQVSKGQFITGSGIHAIFDSPWAPIYIVVIFSLHPALGLFALAAAMILTMGVASNAFAAAAP